MRWLEEVDQARSVGEGLDRGRIRGEARDVVVEVVVGRSAAAVAGELSGGSAMIYVLSSSFRPQPGSSFLQGNGKLIIDLAVSRASACYRRLSLPTCVQRRGLKRR
jgi:hypothetical protein